MLGIKWQLRQRQSYLFDMEGEMVTILLDGAEAHCLTVVELGALDIVSVVLLCSF